jgi:hypothetical protein
MREEGKEMDKKDEMMIVGQDSIINKIYTIRDPRAKGYA